MTCDGEAQATDTGSANAAATADAAVMRELRLQGNLKILIANTVVSIGNQSRLS